MIMAMMMMMVVMSMVVMMTMVTIMAMTKVTVMMAIVVAMTRTVMEITTIEMMMTIVAKMIVLVWLFPLSLYQRERERLSGMLAGTTDKWEGSSSGSNQVAEPAQTMTQALQSSIYINMPSGN